MDYEHLMNEVAVQMAASQLSRYPRNSFGSTSRRWSGRIEKSRSSHTSPAIHERRRAHSTTRPVQPQIYQYPSYETYPITQQRPIRVSRPFSWHPTSSQQMPVFTTVSQIESPAASNYIPTPPFPANSTAPFQHAQMHTVYPELSLPKPANTSHMMAASPVYSVDPYAANSPEWDYFYDGQTPVIADNILPHSSPTYPGSWYGSGCSQVQQLTQPIMHIPQLPPVLHQPSLPSMIAQHPTTISYLPPVSCTTSETLIKEAPMEKPQEEEGEILVALGLYDLPDETTVPISNGSMMLKLTETWQPPSDDEDSSQEDDDDDDDEEVKTPSAGSSWFH